MNEASESALALQAARRSLSQGDAAAAREACLQILREHPDEAGAWHLLGVLEYRDGDLQTAEGHLRRAAEASNTTALYVLSYAELCCRSRDRAGALEMTRRALALDAKLPLGWLSLGTQLLDAREYAEAKGCFEHALQLDPGLWRARAHLAVLLAATGRLAEADACFEQLLRDQPDDAEVIAQHAAYLQDLGRHEDASAEIGRAIRKSPNSLDHHLRAADIDVQRGRIQAALARIESIEHRWANDPKLLASKATVLRLLDRFEEAVVLCRDALAQGAQSADLLRAYAQALHLAGEDSAAFAVLDRAALSHPALALSEKAVLLSTLGRLSEACSTFDRALNHEPWLAAAWYDKANVKTFTAGDPDIAAMGALLDAGCSHRDRILLNFALGKARFETGAADAAFAHWHEGNRLKRALIDYDADTAAETLRSIAAMPLNTPQTELAGARASELPVFVIGMPRCGSSLLEQILASHPDVHGGGEQTRLRELFDPFLETRAGRDELHTAEAHTAEAALRILRRHSVRAARVVDKDLMNFSRLGVILRIFPNARIIRCRRNALDTCFSAYTKLFVGNFPFTYDLRELGLYHRAYHSLMQHWRSSLPARNLFEVDYETLVSQPAETTRRLLDFLELPWNEACMRFFETSRPVNTASLAQVRQPIFRSSVGRSAALRDHLRPLIEALGEPG
jgi:tetratricopeptide (TPR) repeat protein